MFFSKNLLICHSQLGSKNCVQLVSFFLSPIPHQSVCTPRKPSLYGQYLTSFDSRRLLRTPFAPLLPPELPSASPPSMSCRPRCRCRVALVCFPWGLRPAPRVYTASKMIRRCPVRCRGAGPAVASPRTLGRMAAHGGDDRVRNPRRGPASPFHARLMAMFF